jgi:hypothetical protein
MQTWVTGESRAIPCKTATAVQVAGAVWLGDESGRYDQSRKQSTPRRALGIVCGTTRELLLRQSSKVAVLEVARLRWRNRREKCAIRFEV